MSGVVSMVLGLFWIIVVIVFACDSDILYQDRKAGTGIGYRKTGRLPDDMGHRTSF